MGDIRNSKSIELAKKIIENGFDLDCYDPRICQKELTKDYKLNMKKPRENTIVLLFQFLIKSL